MRERVFSRKVLLVRVSIKCCITSDAETSRTSVFITLKAKNKALLIQKGRRKFSQPFKLKADSCCCCKARKNAFDKSRLVLN